MLLRDPLTEQRLIGALIAEPLALELCPDVETDDFTNMNYQAAFMAVRNVQAVGLGVDIESVLAWLEANGRVGVSISAIGEAIASPAYNHESLVRIDARWLRRLARRRQVAKELG